MAGTPAIVVVDIETSGLDEKVNMILEVGILVLGLDLTEIASFTAMATDHQAIAHLDWLAGMAATDLSGRAAEERKPYDDARLVHEMHQRSGLAAHIRQMHANGTQWSMLDIQQHAVAFLEEHKIGKPGLELPMTGSSVHFDRRFLAAQMPGVEARFHYRNIDVSTLKGLVELYRGDIVDEREQVLKADKAHRALSDCRDTVRELEFYLTRTLAKAGAPA